MNVRLSTVEDTDTELEILIGLSLRVLRVLRGGAFLMASLAILATLVSTGCGYSLAGRGSFLPSYIKAIGVPTFVNRTPVFNVETTLTEKVRREFHSIVGITDLAQESVTAGLGYASVFLAYISLVLAVINLFPFLPLDGGHALWSLAEKVRGRRISMAAMYRFSSVGIVLLLFLVINGVSNDIGRLGG